MKNNPVEQLYKILEEITSFSDIHIGLAGNLKNGDLTTNIALQKSKILQKSPMELANDWAGKLSSDKRLRKLFKKIEAIKPGFINFYYSDNYLFDELNNILQTDKYGSLLIGQNKKVVVEYSSPNTNKPLHVGHLRNNSLGMALANMMEFLGYEVIKTQVINDRGIHIMKSILAYQLWGDNKTPEELGIKPDKMVGNFYVKYSKEEKNNPRILDQAKELLRQWEKGNKEVRSLWKKMNDWVYQGWQTTYQIFGSRFDKNYYESNLYDKGREIIEQGEKQGIFYKNNNGAIVVDLSAYGLGDREKGEKVLLRPDNTTVYMTQDIYLAKKRYQEFKFDKMFYVVGDEQIYHFKVLFKILDILGYKWVDRLSHYIHAQVILPEGKMKSREGKVVDADDLIEELSIMAKNEILKRRQNPTADSEDVGKQARIIALSAIKYWFLKTNPKSIIHFNPKQSLDFEGDAGPYLLYTYVRLRSILRKAGNEDLQVDDFDGLADSEREIIRKLLSWPQIIDSFTRDYSLNLITEYLFALAGMLNNYYHHSPILKAQGKLKKVRLQIISGGIKILKTGLDILNIETVEKM